MTAPSVKTRPILFSGAMVRALLDGSKTQTRRVVKLWEAPNGWGVYHSDGANDWEFVHLGEDGDPYADGGMAVRHCPYGVPGERLWVRETFALSKCDPDSGGDTRYPADWNVPVYRADVPSSVTSPSAVTSWKPSIFMPRWASRILLEVTEVRAERVQDISEADAKAEGAACRLSPGGDLAGAFEIADTPICYRAHFRDLWDSINAKRGLGWEISPWVWVVGFKRVGDVR